jgi:hypothetical protein
MHPGPDSIPSKETNRGYGGCLDNRIHPRQQRNRSQFLPNVDAVLRPRFLQAVELHQEAQMTPVTVKRKRLRVYIAGPLSCGDTLENIRRAIQAGDMVFRAGHTPFIPHMNCMWGIVCPHTTEDWLGWDLKWLELCDMLIRLPGESPGSEKEVKFAQEHDIPVLTLEEFLETYSFFTTAD